MKKILATIILSTLLLTSLNAADKFVPSSNDKLAVEYTLEHTDENTDKDFFEFTKAELESIGFFVNDPHHNVNNVYEKQVGATSLNQLSFSSMVNDKVARPLFNKDPRVGGFTPFNLVVYRKKSDNKTVITHITPEAAIDVLQITDEDVKKRVDDIWDELGI